MLGSNLIKGNQGRLCAITCGMLIETYFDGLY